ncbi:MAG: hypothetical protein IJU37_04935 [Desulfovibrio sp.]|nr:hypothetical protein [Desulfovibrio sp.]
MKNHDEAPTKIRYQYQMDGHARLETAHGVWGGINPQGEIEMNFYYESDALPAYSEQIIAPDGSLGHEILPEEQDTRVVNRYIHSRVLLNYHTARALLEWLEDQVAVLEEEGPPNMYETPMNIEQ